MPGFANRRRPSQCKPLRRVGFLTTGQRRAGATGNLTGQGVYAYNIYSQTNALFGDGFRAFDLAGTPFSWRSGTTARLGITIDGDLFSSPSLQALPGGA